jgi:hypothetical protein
MTARGMGLRICWDCHRGCCEAGPPPSMPRCRVSIHENLERILWLRKRRRRKRRRRRRPRSRRRSEFWPGWSAQLRPGSQLRVQFGEWRASGSAFLIPAMAPRCSPDAAKRNPGMARRLPRIALRSIRATNATFSAPQMRAWRRARQIPPQNSGAAKPLPLGG